MKIRIPIEFFSAWSFGIPLKEEIRGANIPQGPGCSEPARHIGAFPSTALKKSCDTAAIPELARVIEASLVVPQRLARVIPTAVCAPPVDLAELHPRVDLFPRSIRHEDNRAGDR